MESLTPSLSITHHPHPLLAGAGRSFHAHGWQAGETVRGVLLAHGFDAHQEIVIGLNDRLLTVAEWDTICPAAGDILNVQVAVSGGDDGSNPLAIVASIALMFVAPYLATAMLGETLAATAIMGTTYGAITAGVISLAGNALINAVFRPSGNNLDRAAGGSAASPTYSLAGGSNALRPYEPLPIVMGVHRIFPDYGSRPFTELSGRDQYLYQMFNFGVSVLSLSDFRIGSTPLSSFSDVAFRWPDAAGVIANFPGNVDTTSGAEISRAAEGGTWVTRTTSADTIMLAADVEGLAVQYHTKKGQLAVSVTVEVEYAVAGSGSWLPMGRSSVPLYSTHYWSLGNWVTVGSYSEWGDTTTTVWTQLSAGTTVYGDHTEGVTGTVPGVRPYYAIQYGTWRWRPYSEILTNGNGSALIEPAPPQPYTLVDYADYTINHGVSSDIQRTTFRRSVASGQYDVRIRLTSFRHSVAEAAVGIPQGTCNYAFTQLRSYQDDPAAYLGQGRLGMVIKASGQLNGVVQQLSALAVAYCNTWDGANWVWGPTSNPAWWYLDFARGRTNSDGDKLYGLFLAEADIDVAAIKTWGSFCAAQGLTFNAVIDRKQSCADVLTMIARCGLASTSWASGKLGVVWDVPDASPVMSFGMGNIARGSFRAEYLSENLADEIVVSFVDGSREWQQQQVRVTVPGTGNPERTSTIELMGCTNATMAGKFANVIAAQQYYRRRTISWEADFEGMVCQRGDVVLLSHDLTQWGYSGRIVSVAGDVVTLDRAVPRTAVDYLMIRQPDGTLTTYTVTAGTGDSDTLTLTIAPALQVSTLPMDHVWTYSPLPTPGKKVKIISVQPLSESRVRLIATDEDPAFYAAWGGSWTQPAVSTLLKDTTPQITSITITEALALLSDDVIGSRASVSIAVDAGFDKIAVNWRVDGGPWTSVEAQAPDLQIDSLLTGLLEIEARPFLGPRIGSVFSASATLAGKTLPPGDVPWLTLNGTSLAWGAVTDLDLAGYQLRWLPGSGADWGQAAPLHGGLLTVWPWTMEVLPYGSVNILIKAVDTSGNESVNATSIVGMLPDPLIANVIETLDIAAGGYPGLISGATVSGGSLLADSAATIWNPNVLAQMWQADGDAMWNLTYYAALTYIATVTVTAPLAGAQMTIGHTIAGESIDLDYRTPAGDSAAMWGHADTLMWGPDAAVPMRAHAPGYAPWPGALTATAGDWQIRIKTNFSRTRGRIDDLSVVWDVPDREVYLDDVVIAAPGGTQLSVGTGWNAIRVVNLTLQNDGGTARTPIVIDKSLAGPLVKCLDATGVATTGKVDAIIQGY